MDYNLISFSNCSNPQDKLACPVKPQAILISTESQAPGHSYHNVSFQKWSSSASLGFTKTLTITKSSSAPQHTALAFNLSRNRLLHGYLLSNSLMPEKAPQLVTHTHTNGNVLYVAGSFLAEKGFHHVKEHAKSSSAADQPIGTCAFWNEVSMLPVFRPLQSQYAEWLLCKPLPRDIRKHHAYPSYE